MSGSGAPDPSWHRMTRDSTRRRRAFTLIEMIGVLAIFAILASLLFPKVFDAINNARISNALLSLQTVKTAVIEHNGKFSALNSVNGTNLPVPPSGAYTNYDGVLVAEGFLEKPFAVKLGTSATIQLVDISALASTTTPDGSNGAYDLNGDGNNNVVGAYLIEAVIFGVLQSDARALNDRLDGTSLGESGGSNQDFLGRVIYHKPPGQGTLYEVHIYITHR